MEQKEEKKKRQSIGNAPKDGVLIGRVKAWEIYYVPGKRNWGASEQQWRNYKLISTTAIIAKSLRDTVKANYFLGVSINTGAAAVNHCYRELKRRTELFDKVLPVIRAHAAGLKEK